MGENQLGKTLVEKIWAEHRVADLGDGSELLLVDRIFLHERTGSIALKGLEAAGRSVRHPEQVFCTMDHIVDTFSGRGDATKVPGGTAFITATREAATQAGINLFDINDPNQGIVHVVAAEQGIALPGITQVCPDSHTCTLGGLGALAWGIGSTEGEHALATKTLPVTRPKQMRVNFNGQLGRGVTAKDMVLKLIGLHSASGGVGYAVEFAGDAVSRLTVEARLTLCNMAVEFGAWTGIIAPDEATFQYVAGRPYAPRDQLWEQALAYWRTLGSDDNALFDREIDIDAAGIAPQVTWGTSPQHSIGIDESVPDPALEGDSKRRAAMERALDYMALKPGERLVGLPLEAAFIGSCTNSRLSDLQAAAAILKGNEVAAGMKAICVPGSSQVKQAAEAEGLHRIFIDAGFEWRESGCSMCFFAGGESFGAGERVISTTNRNFENRQGPGTRSHLASPTTVAASALVGHIVDVRSLESQP
jgi:3-isopropylmalate/(R)-2-methylmalate dehydratase large subunit